MVEIETETARRLFGTPTDTVSEMIRPDTQPGTDVICINAEPGPFGAGLLLGEIYTVERIVKTIDGGYAAVLADIKPWQSYSPPYGLINVGFNLSRFRYIDIPPELERMLTQKYDELLSV